MSESIRLTTDVPSSSTFITSAAAAPAPPPASPPPPPRLFRYVHDDVAALALAFIGGYVDAAGYVGLFGLFTGSITGNVVVAATTVSGAPTGVVPRVVVTACFVGGSAVGHVVAAAASGRVPPPGGPQRAVARTLLALEALALGGAWLAGQVLSPAAIAAGGSGGPNVTLVGALMGLAMGLQNGAVKEALPGFPSTTVMTSTLVTCGSQLTAWALAGAAAARAGGSGAAASKAGAALLKSALPLLLFIVGACLGSALQHHIAFNSMCVPAGALCALCALLSL